MNALHLNLHLWPRLRGVAAMLLAVLASGYAVSARADIWGYVSADGVAHFSAQKLDARYELFFKSGEGFDTSTRTGTGGRQSAGKLGLPGAALSHEGQGLAAAPPKLLAFFDISPNYKAVKHLLRDASVTHGIDYELLQALIATESGFNASAVSPKGAVGLMQVIPPTAERFGVRASKDATVQQKLTDPRTNIAAGSRYLRYLINKFPGQLELAVASYNAGEGAVQRAGNKIPNYPETKNYVQTVLQLYGHLKPPNFAAAPAGRVRMEMMGGAPLASARGALPNVVLASEVPAKVAVN